MIYTIRHSTRFRYSEPVRESVTEVQLNPVSAGLQRCFNFRLQIFPYVPVSSYLDQYNNRVHHFNIAYDHRQLTITAESTVGIRPAVKPLDSSVLSVEWKELETAIADTEMLEWLVPGQFSENSKLLESFLSDLNLSRNLKPFELAMETNVRLFKALTYLPNSTQVDSPIDDALKQRAGVCQDYSHIFLAILRRFGIPCRYVSGYLFHAINTNNQSPDTESHAWIEAWFPGIGWLGLDPTNNKLAGDHHIILAFGRDYTDVPPTRGVFKGNARTEMSISVQIVPEETTIARDVFRIISHPEGEPEPKPIWQQGSQQQQ